MAKSGWSIPKLNQQLTKIISSSKPHKTPKQIQLKASKPSSIRVDSTKMENHSLRVLEGQNRVPLAHVVADCVKRWFQDSLKEAKAGDVNMQVLVGQMYNAGYGVPADPDLGRAWINKASRSRSSALQVSEKPPGYHASDSDSNDPKDGRK